MGRCPSLAHDIGVGRMLDGQDCRMCGGSGLLPIREWSETEVQQLRSMWLVRNVADIAFRLRRPVSDVWDRAAREGLQRTEPSDFINVRPMIIASGHAPLEDVVR